MKVWLGVAGLVAVALLGWLLWPSAAAAPTVLQTSTKHFGVRLTVEDPKPGLNVIGIELTDPQGRPADARTVTVEPAMPRMGHALEPVPATAEAPGRYRATGTTLPMSGQWEITVAINGVERAVFGLLVND
ncbi:FixH family protein [Amycolatopsis suaedae]|uniref:FixH family protein n=1 Tax=Amycolatopsis suaedae TaxID=2510978 RepID=UPI001F0E4A54|nr:FixH family protein [Amycolatopsis suaedae]